MTVGEYIRNKHVCPYCGSSDYHVFDNAIIDVYKCMGCHRKMWETEVLFEREETITDARNKNMAINEQQRSIIN